MTHPVIDPRVLKAVSVLARFIRRFKCLPGPRRAAYSDATAPRNGEPGDNGKAGVTYPPEMLPSPDEGDDGEVWVCKNLPDCGTPPCPNCERVS